MVLRIISVVMLGLFLCAWDNHSSIWVWAFQDDTHNSPAPLNETADVQFVGTNELKGRAEERNASDRIGPGNATNLENQQNSTYAESSQAESTPDDEFEQLITQVPSWWRYSLSDYMNFVLWNSLSKPGAFTAELYDYILVDSPRVLDKLFRLLLKQLESLGTKSKLSEENSVLVDKLITKLASIKSDLTL